MISVGAYVLLDGRRRALVECEGNGPHTWDICFDDDRTEAAAVPETRLVLDSTQPVRQSRDVVLANVAFLLQKRKGHHQAPDLMWKSDSEGSLGGAVYVGNMYSAADRKILAAHGITHIVNCTADLPCNFRSGGRPGTDGGSAGDGDATKAAIPIKYLRFDAIDVFSGRLSPSTSSAGDSEGSILEFFDPMFRFVDEATEAGGSVLIHCVAGAHRAGTTACAYVMHRDRALTAAAAIAHCKSRRTVIDPGISARLVAKLEGLEAAHAGTAMPMQSWHQQAHAEQPVDLDAEGYKVLAALAAERRSHWGYVSDS